MNTHILVILLQIAGLLHVGLLCAGSLMPRVVGMEVHLRILPPFISRLFWVYYSFIGLCLVSFGILTFGLAPALADGSALSRSFCVFLASFWILRLVAATFVFDLSPCLTTRARRVGYHLTNAVFVYLPIVYLVAAWKGVK